MTVPKSFQDSTAYALGFMAQKSAQAAREYLGVSGLFGVNAAEWPGVDKFGVLDSTAGVRMLLETLPNTTGNVYNRRGGLVQFPSGQYRFTDDLEVFGGIYILGESPESTVFLVEHNDGDLFYGETPDGSSSSIIHRYQFANFSVKKKAGTIATSGAAIHIRPQTITAPVASVASNVMITNVYVYNMYRGIDLYAIQGGFMFGVKVTFCQSDGVLIDGYATEFGILGGCDSSGNGLGGSGHGYFIKGAAYSGAHSSGGDSNRNYTWRWDDGPEQTAHDNSLVSCGGEGSNDGTFYLRRQQSMCLLSCFGVMDPGPVTQNGILLDECLFMTLINCEIATQPACLGSPLKIINYSDDGTGASVAFVLGGKYGPFAGAATIVNPEVAPIVVIGFQSDNRFSINGAGQPSVQFDVCKPAHGVGAVGAILGRFYQRSTNNGGSGRLLIGSDAGTTSNLSGLNFGYLEQNGLVGPFNTGSAFDTILGSMAGNVWISPFGAPGALKVDASVAAGETRMLVHDVDTGILQRVKVGAAGSGPGGVGRALYLA
jgi:hypothetical protein